MALSNTPIFTQTPKISTAKIVITDGTTAAAKTIYTAGANGSKIIGLVATNDNTTSRIVQIWYTRSAVNYLLWSYTVLAGAGNGPNGSLDMLFNGQSGFLNDWLPMDNDGQRFFFLQSGDTLTCNVTVAVENLKTFYITAVGADF